MVVAGLFLVPKEEISVDCPEASLGRVPKDDGLVTGPVCDVRRDDVDETLGVVPDFMVPAILGVPEGAEGVNRFRGVGEVVERGERERADAAST